MSKRDGAVSIEEYRNLGYLPEALLNYLVRLGWSHGDQEVFSRDELVAFFSLDKVGKKGGIFDVKKLLWLNGIYMRQADAATILRYLGAIDEKYIADLQGLWNPEQLNRLIDEYKQRATTLIELYNGIRALATEPVVLDLQLIEKWRTEKTPVILAGFASAVTTVTPFSHDQLLAAAQEICQKENSKLVELAQPLRLALTGSIVSPGVFELIAVLGQERACKRLSNLIAQLG